MKKTPILFCCLFVLSAFSTFAQIPVNGLIAYYPFSGNANDRTANSYHGTVSGALLSTNRFGQSDSAYQFDGSNDYILFSSSFDVLPRTISVWFNATSIDNTYRIIYSCDNKNLVYGANTIAVQKLNNENKIIYVACGVQDTINITPNAWHNATIIVDTVFAHFYLNCNSVSSIPYSMYYHSLDVTTNATVGTARALNNRFFTGLIDDLRIYNRVLNANERSQLCLENKYVGMHSDYSNSSLVVYPNPASKQITIDMSALPKGSYTVQITDCMGRCVLTKAIDAEMHTIDISSIQSKGMYCIQLVDESLFRIQSKTIILE